MPTLWLLCGLPGSGKTTYARQVSEQGRGVRLSSDDWMVPLFGQTMSRAEFDRRQASVRELQWEVARQALGCGVDVLLDEGFWRRADRDEYRRRAGRLGVAVRLVWFDVPLPELRYRLAARNAALPAGTFVIDEAALELFAAQFEPPQPDEQAQKPEVLG